MAIAHSSIDLAASIASSGRPATKCPPHLPGAGVGVAGTVSDPGGDLYGLVEEGHVVGLVQLEAGSVAPPDQPPHPLRVVVEPLDAVLMPVEELVEVEEPSPVIEQLRPVEDQIDELGVTPGARPQVRQELVGPLEMRLRLDQRIAIHRLGPGDAEEGHCLFRHPGLGVVVGQGLGHLAQATHELLLDGCRRPTVQLDPLLLEQTLIGHVLGEGVLEEVLEFGVRPLPDQVGVLEVGQARVERGSDGGDPLYHLVEELSSHHRRLPKHPSPGGVQPIDPGRDHPPDRRGHLGTLQLAGDSPAVVVAAQSAGLDQGVDDLLDEERIPVGAGDDEADQLARGVVDLQERGEHLTRLARR